MQGGASGKVLQMEREIVTVQYNYDVAIVGSGVAGLFGACHMDPSLKVLVIAKREPDLTNTSLAQGGIAAVLDTVHDNQEDHMKIIRTQCGCWSAAAHRKCGN